MSASLLCLNDDALACLFALSDVPLALKATCRSFRDLHPQPTNTKVGKVVQTVSLARWALRDCGLDVAVLTRHAAMTYPSGTDVLADLEASTGLDRAVLCCHAARAGSVPMLRWLGFDAALTSTAALVAAASDGHIECLQWMMLGRLDRAPEALTNGCLLQAAAAQNHVAMSAWLVHQGSPVTDQQALIVAARCGHVDVLHLLLLLGFSWTLQCFYRAMGPHNRTITPLPRVTVEYLVENELARDRQILWELALGDARHVDTVRWLAEHDPEGSLFNGPSRPLWAVAERGGVEVLRLARDHGAELEPELADCAAFGDQRDTLSWLHAQGVTGSSEAIFFAAQQNNVGVLQLLHAHGGYDFGGDRVYFAAAAGGAVQAAEWALSVGIPLPSSAHAWQQLLEEARECRRPQMLEWLLRARDEALE